MCEPCFPLEAPRIPTKLEQGIPFEMGPRKNGRVPKYQFWKMQVGESFFVPASDSNRHNVRTSLTTCSRHSTRLDGFRFTVRIVDGGIRVWRVA